MSRSFPAALLFVTVVALTGACDGCGRRAPTASAPSAPVTAATFTADAPTWLWIDLAALRADPRTAAVWQAAGPAVGSELLGDMSTAEALVVTWRDATFARRVNVLDGGTAAPPTPDALTAAGFVSYRAGPYTVWSRGADAWAIAMPGEDLLVTGSPDAVREVLAQPCDACTAPYAQRPAGTVLAAGLRVTDALRRVAGLALSTAALDRALAVLDSVRADIVLGLGADVLVRFTPAEGHDLAFVNLLLSEVIAALRGVLERQPEAAFAGALLDRAQLRASGDTLELSLEVTREELDALVAMLASPSTGRPTVPNLPEPRPQEP